MVIDTLDDFQTFLLDRDNYKSNNLKTGEHCKKRIFEIVRSDQLDKQCNDFLGLLRQIIVTNKLKAKNADLMLPNDLIRNIDDRMWEKFNLSKIEEGFNSRISAKKYNPEWIHAENSLNTDEWFESSLEVREDLRVPMDKFLLDNSRIKFDSYTFDGQRQALSAVLRMPKGSTLVVNLPTGSGKTLLFHAPLLMREAKGLTVVIVPTTALALDQERRFLELGIHTKKEPRAFHSGLDEVEKQEIKHRIRQGTQDILFSSPEAVVKNLLPALYDCAENGMLSYLFVDEAHMISDWGDTFRKDFQALAGVWRGLSEVVGANNFKTVLLSATFTKIDLELIDILFGPPQRVQFFSAIHMRPEPKYYSFKVSDPEMRLKVVVELSKFIPKPAILYTSKPDEAEKLQKKLKGLGFSKVGLFTGKTPNVKRIELVKLWAERKLDFMVATSAFGVGIDKEDVRTVLHATIPETVERFYQEVGRSGRDGKSSNSIVIFCEEDKEASTRLATGRPEDNIGHDLAFYRWNDMFNKKVTAGKDKYLVNTFETLHLDGTGHSSKNEHHNLTTLFTMQRAKLIELYSFPPKHDHNESESETFEYFEKYYKEVQIKIIDHQHNEEKYFSRKFSRARTMLVNARKKSNSTLIKMLEAKISVEDALTEIYSSSLENRNIDLAKVCRGCPAKPSGTTSNSGKRPYKIMINGIRNFEFLNKISQDFERHCKKNSLVLFNNFEKNELFGNKMINVLRILFQKYEISQMNIPKAFAETSDVNDIYKEKKQNPLFVNPVDFRKVESYRNSKRFLKLPTVSVLLPWEGKPVPEWFESNIFQFHVIIAPQTIFCADNNRERILIEQYPLLLSDFLEKVEGS